MKCDYNVVEGQIDNVCGEKEEDHKSRFGIFFTLMTINILTVVVAEPF
jgi:hypothetical protein